MAVMIPDIFSAYLQGKRNAITDNWNDLNQYNTVLKGQLSNAMDMATFGDNVRRNNYNAQQSRFNALRNGLQAVNDAAALDMGLGQMGLVDQYGIPNLQAQYNAMLYQQALGRMASPQAAQQGAAQQGAAQQGTNPPGMPSHRPQPASPAPLPSELNGITVPQEAMVGAVPLVQPFAGGDPGIADASKGYFRLADGSIARQMPGGQFLYVSHPYD